MRGEGSAFKKCLGMRRLRVRRRLRLGVMTPAARAPEVNRVALFSCPNRGCGWKSWMNPMRPSFGGRARPDLGVIPHSMRDPSRHKNTALPGCSGPRIYDASSKMLHRVRGDSRGKRLARRIYQQSTSPLWALAAPGSPDRRCRTGSLSGDDELGIRAANFGCHPGLDPGSIDPNTRALPRRNGPRIYSASSKMLRCVLGDSWWITAAPWDDRENKGGTRAKTRPTSATAMSAWGNARFSLVSGRAIAVFKQKRRPHTGVRRWT